MHYGVLGRVFLIISLYSWRNGGTVQSKRTHPSSGSFFSLQHNTSFPLPYPLAAFGLFLEAGPTRVQFLSHFCCEFAAVLGALNTFSPLLFISFVRTGMDFVLHIPQGFDLLLHTGGRGQSVFRLMKQMQRGSRV